MTAPLKARPPNPQEPQFPATPRLQAWGLSEDHLAAAHIRCPWKRRSEIQVEAPGEVEESLKEHLWFSLFLSIYVCNKLTLIQLASIVFISSEAITQAVWGIR